MERAESVDVVALRVLVVCFCKEPAFQFKRSPVFFLKNFLVGAELSVVQMISRTRQTEYEKFMAESKVKELQQDNGTKAIPSKRYETFMAESGANSGEKVTEIEVGEIGAFNNVTGVLARTDYSWCQDERRDSANQEHSPR